MSDEKKKTFVGKIGEIASLKEIVYGILVIAGLLGGLYGSFKPEVVAEKNHEELKPVVTQVEEIATENHEDLTKYKTQLEEAQKMLNETMTKLHVLEQKFGILELVNVSLINNKGSGVDLEQIYNLFKDRRTRERARLKKIDVNPSPNVNFDLK